MIRFGLCCIFKDQPIKFRQTTAKYLSQFPRKRQMDFLSEICLANGETLIKALTYCHGHGIGDFRINSQILPLKTHPDMAYDIMDLPGGEKIVKRFKACGEFSKENNIRTTFHPDQFNVLSSVTPDVVRRSVETLEYQAGVAEWVNADVINIHGGGVYGDKRSALIRLRQEIDLLPDPVRSRLTLENDDRCYTPEDLIPVCMDMNIPLVYDVHHHECFKDSLTIGQATDLALKTWDREPLFHLSSPINGWDQSDRRKHHDYIDIKDFPQAWSLLDLTVEVEAKAKELAILKLIRDFKEKCQWDLNHPLIRRNQC